MFFDKFFPIKEKEGEVEEGRGTTLAIKSRERFTSIFETQKDSMSPATAGSKYGILQAYTDMIDHPDNMRTNTDEASIIWDSITGVRASKKESVFNYLVTV